MLSRIVIFQPGYPVPSASAMLTIIVGLPSMSDHSMPGMGVNVVRYTKRIVYDILSYTNNYNIIKIVVWRIILVVIVVATAEIY